MKSFFRKLSIIALMLITFYIPSRADVIQVGTGIVLGNYPFTQIDEDAASYFLYRAAEIVAAGGSAGMIRSIAFQVNTDPNQLFPLTFKGLTISMQTTTATNVTGPITTGWQQVYYSASYTMTSTGWNTFSFPENSYFNYTSGQNLLVKVCFNNPSGEFSTVNKVYGSIVTGTAHCRYGSGDGCSNTFAGSSAGASTPRPNARFDFLTNPKLMAVYPPAVPPTVIAAGSIIPFNSDLQPAVDIKRAAGQPTVYVSYKIVGPTSNPNPTMIYEAVVEGDTASRIPLNVVGDPIPYRYKFTHARGPAAYIDPLEGSTGQLDFSNPGLESGEYTIYCTFEIDGRPDLTATTEQKFNISLPWDLVGYGIPYPLTMDFTKYPMSGGGSIPLGATVLNAGLNPVDSFRVECRIFQNGVLVHQPPNVLWVNKAAPLLAGHTTTIMFESFVPTGVGEFDVQIRVRLLNSQDLNTANDVYPVGNNKHTFKITYGIDAKADALLSPTATNYLKRPIPIVGKFLNNGFEDILDGVAKVSIKDGRGNEVFYDEKIVENVPATNPPFAYVRFDNEFVPEELGVFTATISMEHPFEGNPMDNAMTTSFEIVTGMEGTFTVSATGTGSNNFNSLTDAIEALYQRGVAGPVVIELKDPEYNIGDITSEQPAIDLRTKIIGVSDSATITFRPSSDKAATRGSVVINLRSASGIGILFGQSYNHAAPLAAVNFVNNEVKRDYASSDGYIIFDGGDQKSLLFKVQTPDVYMFRTAFYMGEGTQNITVKNCLIDGQTTSKSLANSLPRIRFEFSADRGDYYFDANYRTTGTYSAGVILRNTPPIYTNTQTNYFSLDTLNIHNVVIENNEITNFGYGIVSLGLGVLNKIDGPNTTITKFFNHNNKFIKNSIYNVGRAGIFLGYEENTIVNQNRIYDIASITNDVAGIIVGGEDKSGMLGYYNNDIRVDGNEINNLSSSLIAYGIKVEQSSYTLTEGISTLKFFPTVNERFVIANNIVRDIKALTNGAHRVGISLGTARDLTAPTFEEMMITPAKVGFFTKDDKIVNNTIVIPNDAFSNTGNVAGIVTMQNKRLMMFNNAISILDDDIANGVEVSAAVSYYNALPAPNDIQIDRNAFWLTPNIDYYRVVEKDNERNLVELGFAREFALLNQWRYWTGADINSVEYNFLEDMEYKGDYPSRLRIKSNPTPINSKISNRGDRIAGINVDIDGQARGDAHQRYDIGACEFHGRMFNNDIEIHSITQPGAYMDVRPTSLFNDAEYIMTTAPVDVKAIVRNNGNMLVAAARVKVEIFREDTLGNFPSTPILSKVVNASINATDDTEISFGLADGLDNDDFIPLTYLQLTGYPIADHFSTMKPNITPRHKIRVSLAQADEVSGNNVLEDKIVRFYLKRSRLDLLLSMENSYKTIAPIDTNNGDVPTPELLDDIAGRLNSDTLIAAMNKIGWHQTKGEADHDFDILDRRGWEERSVNYPIYRSLMFSDGDDKQLSRFAIGDLIGFMAQGSLIEKKNMIIASQDIVRENAQPSYLDGLFLANNILRVEPAGTRPYDSVSTVKGFAIARNLLFQTKPTGFVGDPNPIGDLTSIYAFGYGVPRVAFYYLDPEDELFTDKIMGVATSTLATNVVYLGTDWRHFQQADALIRSAMDYIENNGGSIIPIELLSFDAVPVGNRVELNWITASELNSSRFDIERADVDYRGIGTFTKIDEVRANGNSNVALEYGPIIDRQVKAGNTYAYRLKLVDVNGEFSYSDEKIVTMDNAGSLAINSISPNPAIDNAAVSISLPAESQVRFDIYDASGKLLVSTNYGSVAAGTSEISIDTKSLSSGTYKVVLVAGNATTASNLNVVR